MVISIGCLSVVKSGDTRVARLMIGRVSFVIKESVIFVVISLVILSSHTHTATEIQVHMCVCVHVRLCFSCVCMYIYTYMFMYMYRYRCIHTCALYTHMCICVTVLVCTWANVSAERGPAIKLPDKRSRPTIPSLENSSFLSS